MPLSSSYFIVRLLIVSFQNLWIISSTKCHRPKSHRLCQRVNSTSKHVPSGLLMLEGDVESTQSIAEPFETHLIIFFVSQGVGRSTKYCLPIAQLLHLLLNILADLTWGSPCLAKYWYKQTPILKQGVQNMVHGYILLLTLHLRVYYYTVILFNVTSPEQLP